MNRRLDCRGNDEDWHTPQEHQRRTYLYVLPLQQGILLEEICLQLGALHLADSQVLHKTYCNSTTRGKTV